jgi:hypothetical protein
MDCPLCGQEIKQTPTREIIFRATELIEYERCTWDEALKQAWLEHWGKNESE